MRLALTLTPCFSTAALCDGYVQNESCSAWPAMLAHALNERGLSLDVLGLCPRGDLPLHELPPDDEVQLCRRDVRKYFRRTAVPTHVTSVEWAQSLGATHGAFLAAAVLEGFEGSRCPELPHAAYFAMERKWLPPSRERTPFEQFVCSLTNWPGALGAFACMVRADDSGVWDTPDHARSLAVVEPFRGAVKDAIAMWEQRQREDVCDAITEKP